MSLLANLKQRARLLKRDTFVLYLAARHPSTPWYAKAFAAGVAAYALSPIDLIPDFVPVFGYLDDLILLPLGIALAVRLVPSAVLDECRRKADEEFAKEKPSSRIAGMVVIAVWIACAALIAMWLWKAFGD